MSSTAAANLQTVREYLLALQAGATGERLARFFTPDAMQVELPNRLNPNGGISNLAVLLQRAEQGRQMLRSQRYEIVSEIAQGERVAVEALWTCELGVSLGTLAAGDAMKAHFAMFFEFADGKIRVQRNYDCFQPW